MLLKIFLFFFGITPLCESVIKNPDKLAISSSPTTTKDYFDAMQLILIEIFYRTKVDQCYAIITDEYHEHIFEGHFFSKQFNNLKGNFFLKLLNSEDMLSPNYRTVKILKQIKAHSCDLVFLLLFNGIQLKRFLIFMERNRILNTGANFVLLYDRRIFVTNLHYIWRKIISVIFIRQIENDQPSIRFNLVTVTNLGKTFIRKRVSGWKNGKITIPKNIFITKTNNLKGTSLKVVVQEHIPMVIKQKPNVFVGLEVEIMNSLSKIMNFTFTLYESPESQIELWGRHLSNGSFTGLIGEIVNRKSDIALGDLHLNKFYMDIMDLTIPHSTECLSFLTPELTANNSWKTLILPLNGDMWAGVLISLIFVGSIFYAISHFQNLIVSRRFKRVALIQLTTSKNTKTTKRTSNTSLKKYHVSSRPPQRDIFDEFSNCILLTYSMLLLVSLPAMPKNWPLRVLTGWYWIYCILVAVIYRSSFTAILANPSPRITIDTLKELAENSIIVGAWGEQNKRFFLEAFDENVQKIGEKLEEVQDINGTVERIINGKFAYYDNEYFLRSLRLQGHTNRQDGDELHIMKECVINMPISIGLEKNSPLKANFDKYVQRLIEGGFISKWLKDYTSNLPSEEQPPQEAIIDLRKFWSSFIVLIVGYMLGVLTLIVEKYYFKYIVQCHPLYDPYNQRVYYEFMRNKKTRK